MDSKAEAKADKAAPEKRSYQVSADTRREIVERAADAFGEKGFQGASLRGIARAAGIDHSTLIHHFGTKATLLEEVLRWRDREAIPSDLQAGITVRGVVEAIVKVARENQETPGITQLFSMMSAEAGEEGHPARDYLRKRHAAHLAVFGDIIETRRAAGKLRENGLTPREEAARIVATWEGLEVFDRLHPGLLDLPKALEVTLLESLGLGDGDGDEVIEVPTDVLARWDTEPASDSH